MNIGTAKKYQELLQEFSKTPRADVNGFRKKTEEVLSEFFKLDEVYTIASRSATVEEVNDMMKKATIDNPSFGYNEEQIVSSDVIGSSFGSLFDATQTDVTSFGDNQIVKTVAWYDNEFGFVTQLVRTLAEYASL